MKSSKWALSIAMCCALLGAVILSACQPIMPVDQTAPASESEAAATPLPEIPGEILIPAGEFQMGCDEENTAENCRAVELPLHTVFLDNYYIDQFEVTNARYQACVSAGGCEPPSQLYSTNRDNYYGNPEFDDYPVIFVDWFQAEAFCQWERKRLPTEAEWMKAARGADDTRKYPWGDEAPTCDLSNYWEGSDGCVGDTLAVGTLPDGASPYGVMNMAGNVGEWVSDWYSDDYYRVSESDNPAGPDDGSTKTIMDAAFEMMGTSSDNTSRTGFSLNTNYHWLAFRCAHSP